MGSASILFQMLLWKKNPIVVFLFSTTMTPWSNNIPARFIHDSFYWYQSAFKTNFIWNLVPQHAVLSYLFYILNDMSSSEIDLKFLCVKSAHREFYECYENYKFKSFWETNRKDNDNNFFVHSIYSESFVELQFIIFNEICSYNVFIIFAIVLSYLLRIFSFYYDLLFIYLKFSKLKVEGFCQKTFKWNVKCFAQNLQFY